jgi:hypothetical protein
MIDDQTSSGALNVSHSTGVSPWSGNTLEACRSVGFYIRDAKDTTLIGNTIIDLWRTSAASQAFYVLKDDVGFTIDMIGNVMGTNGLSKPNINTTAVGGTSDATIVLRMTSNRLTGAVNSTMTKMILAPNLYVETAADQTVNNSATLTASGLALSVEANSKYRIEGFVAYNSSQTADMIIGWTYPTGATIRWTPDSLFISSTSAAGQVYRTFATESDTGILGGPGAANGEALVTGMVTTGSTAGTLTLMFAQNVAEVSNTVLLAKSSILLTKVA